MLNEFRIALGKLLEVRRNAKRTRPELEAHKLEKFRRFVRKCARRSPYYAELIAERGIDIDRCTPRDFPPLTKSALMANFDRIVTDRKITKRAVAEFLSRSTDPNDLFLDSYHVLHTSGSSGEVGYFLYSTADWARAMGRGAAGRMRFPKRPRGQGRIRTVFYGATGGHYAGVSLASAAMRGIAKWFIDMRVCEINSPLPSVIAQLNDFQPVFLSGYTNALKILAEKQREGVLKISPLLVSASGESVTEADREAIGSAFGCGVLNGYGCTEHLMMGAQGPDERYMTLYDDDLIFEPFEDHTLVTNLFNETMPLIRYRMSDVLRPVNDPSATGPYLRIESLVGRTETPPKFLNEEGAEDFLSPHTINEIFVKGVTRFQMQLLDRESFRFLVCLDSTLTQDQRGSALAGVERRIREILTQKTMRNVRFEVRVVDDLPVNPRTRKFQLIVAADAA